jgi:hypothetical protein
MRWARQVAHVAAKDVRFARWVYGLYTLAVVVATLGFTTGRALGPYSPTENTTVLAMPEALVVVLPLLSIALAVLMIGTLVQADSPTRANTLWASRPLSASAVLSAKLVAAIVIVILPLIGATAALATLDTSRSDVVRMIVHAAMGMLAWLLAGLALGAITENLLVLISALIGTLVALIVITIGFGDFLTVFSQVDPRVVRAAGIVAALALLLYLYRTRDSRRRIWFGGLASAALLMYGTAPISRGQEAPTVAAEMDFRVEMPAPIVDDRQRPIAIGLGVGRVSESDRLDFHPETVVVKATSGRSVLSTGYFASQPVHMALLPLDASLHWLIAPDMGMSNAFQFEPTASDWQELSRGMTSVHLAGTVVASRAHLLGSIPLRRGSHVVHDGRRLTIEAFTRAGNAVDVNLRPSHTSHAFLAGLTDPTLVEHDGLEFALVNASRGEAIGLSSRQTSSNSGTMVLPWIDVTTTYMRLTTPQPAPPVHVVLPDDAWFANAQLVLFEWRPVGQFRVAADAKR